MNDYTQEIEDSKRTIKTGGVIEAHSWALPAAMEDSINKILEGRRAEVISKRLRWQFFLRHLVGLQAIVLGIIVLTAQMYQYLEKTPQWFNMPIAGLAGIAIYLGYYIGWSKQRVKIRISRKTQLTRYYIYSSKWLGIKLHHIHGEDKWHTHPWNGISFILGSYQEDLGKGYKRRWFINWIGARRRHRVKGNTWSLFINFWRINRDWEWDGVVAPFRGPDQ